MSEPLCPTCGGSMRFCECMDDPFAAVPCGPGCEPESCDHEDCHHRHEWLDRPESDTRECLICGTEVGG